MAERRATLGKAEQLLEEGFRPVRDDGGGQWIYSDEPELEEVSEETKPDETQQKPVTAKKPVKRK